MDPFDQLPVELVRLIIEEIDDFVGLESLLCVSARAQAVFQASAKGIIEHLLITNSILAVPAVQRLFRQVALVQSPSVHCSTFDEYTRLISGFSPSDPLQDVDKGTLFRMVHIAAQVQRLACACLSIMLEKFESAIKRSSTSLQSGAQCLQITTEPFSFIEEYRVFWAIWHLRHFSDLRQIARKPASHGGWGWSTESIERLDAYVTWNSIYHWSVEVILSVADVLEDLGLHSAPIQSGKQQPGIPFTFLGSLPEETPIPFLPSFETSIVIRKYPVWSSKPTPEDTEINRFWGRSCEFFMEDSGTARMLRSLCPSSSHHVSYPSYWHALRDIRTFRPLGVFIWDRWRMYLASLGHIERKETVITPYGELIEEEPQSRPELILRWESLTGCMFPNCEIE